jgi:glucose-6-phosphate 1-dehydrogenase
LEVNHLSLCIQPDEGTHLSFELKVPGAGMRTKSVEMDFHYEEYFGQKALPEAYERLLLDALQGDQSLFGRSDEIEQAWELVTPLLKEWEGMENPPLIFYEDGSLGPEKSKELIERDGRTWLLLCSEHPKPPEEERM